MSKFSLTIKKRNATAATVLLIFLFIFLSIIIFSTIFTNILGSIPPTHFPQIVSRLLFIFLVLIGASVILLVKNYLYINRTFSDSKIAVILLFSALIISLPLVLYTNVEPFSDFGRYYENAIILSEGGNISFPDFIAAFPHNLIFSVILSFIFRLFGTSVQVAQFSGALFSAFSVVLIFLIGKKTLGEKHGLWASILWLFMPSRILYTLLISTENLFNFISLIIIYFFLEALDCHQDKKRHLLFGLTGILFALLAAIRPNGMIIMIACFIIYLLFIKEDESSHSKKRSPRKLIVSLIIISCYLISSFLINVFIEDEIDRPTTSNALGWNFYVGMNEESNGRWNNLDNDRFWTLLSQKGPEETQNELFKLAIERLRDIIEHGNIFSFIYAKTLGMWHADHDPLIYSRNSQVSDLNSINFFEKNEKVIKYISNWYYYMLILLSMLSLLSSIKKQDFKIIIILSALIILGIVALHIPLEAQMRYKNHALIWLCFIASNSKISIIGVNFKEFITFGFNSQSSKEEKKVNQKR